MRDEARIYDERRERKKKRREEKRRERSRNAAENITCARVGIK